MQLQITSDRIYCTNPRGEQMIIGHPPEYADAIVTVTNNMVAGLEPEKAIEKPKKETEGG